MTIYSSEVVQLTFKKIKNKPATFISNLSVDEIEEICKNLRKRLGCGGSIDKEKNVIILQGNHLNKLMEQKSILLPNKEVVKLENI